MLEKPRLREKHEGVRFFRHTGRSNHTATPKRSVDYRFKNDIIGFMRTYEGGRTLWEQIKSIFQFAIEKNSIFDKPSGRKLRSILSIIQ